MNVIILKVICYVPLFLGIGSLSLKGQNPVEVKKVSITVSNLENALKFYTGVLPFDEIKTYSLDGQVVQDLFGVNDKQLKLTITELKLGTETIELLEFESKKFPKRTIPLDSRSNDLWFQHIAIVVNDINKAYQILWDNQVTHVSTAPQTLPDYIPAAAGISAFYFRDPDNHNLELIYFPKGKGNPRWHEESGELFLGIDHTAIGIERTKESLTFYQDFIKLEVAGNSENYGTEQEHLNQVFGARLLITGLQAPKGLGVEFLDYIAPPGGRMYPKESRPTDLWHWHTSIQVNDIEKYYKKAIISGYEIISHGLVQLEQSPYKGQKAFMVRDPDGHALLLFE